MENRRGTDPMLQMKRRVLKKFYKDNRDKIIEIHENPNIKTKFKQFYETIYNKVWTKTDTSIDKWYKYYNINKKSIARSLSQIAVTRTRSEAVSTGVNHPEHYVRTDVKLHKSKPFLEPSVIDVDDSTELTEETDLYVTPDERKMFSRPEPNKNPKIVNAVQDLNSIHEPILPQMMEYDERMKSIFDRIPSVNRNTKKYINLSSSNYDYADYFKPKSYKNLYDKSKAKMFVGPPGTWMFDIMYFSDHNIKKYRQYSKYLVGININTRYAVARRINGKKVQDLIPAFENMFKHELKNKISMLIFDGEKAISSKEFEKFCIKHNIVVRITYPGIHTQTGPIDRLCRTLRHYYMKFYMVHNKKIKNILNNNNRMIDRLITPKDLLTETIQIRKVFDGENKHKTALIPREYYVYDDMVEADYVYTVNDLDKYKDENRYYYVTKGDELYNIIAYYNNNKHHGLMRILSKASSLFKRKLQIFDLREPNHTKELQLSDITPTIVNDNPELESMIISYCRYHNENVEKNYKEYEIGDKVKVYDCFTTDRGNLQRVNPSYIIGDWEIETKDNEIYGVRNNEDKKLLHVSKYMISNN